MIRFFNLIYKILNKYINDLFKELLLFMQHPNKNKYKSNKNRLK